MILEFVYGVSEYVWSVVPKLGVHEDNVTTCQTALDDGADLVEVGVPRQHQQC